MTLPVLYGTLPANEMLLSRFSQTWISFWVNDEVWCNGWDKHLEYSIYRRIYRFPEINRWKMLSIRTKPFHFLAIYKYSRRWNSSSKISDKEDVRLEIHSATRSKIKRIWSVSTGITDICITLRLIKAKKPNTRASTGNAVCKQ